MSKGKTKREIFNDMNYTELTKRGKEPLRPGIAFIIWVILKLSVGSFLLVCDFLLVIITGGDLQTALREGDSCFPAVLQLLNIFAAVGLGIYIMSDATRRNQLKISIQMTKNAFRHIAKKYVWKLRVLFNKKTRKAK
jgi:hypothetical protein